MPLVVVDRIESYACRPEILRFIESALNMNAGIAALLGNGDPQRLVVLKPNWVQESHEYMPEVWEPVITHPEILLAVIECLARRMQGKGTICVCDAPHTYASFDRILARGEFHNRLGAIQRQWPSLNLEVLDLRKEIWVRKEEVVVQRLPNSHDPRGYVRLDLRTESLFFEHPGEGRFYGADYDSSVVNEHHRGELHEYLIAGTPIQCDVFINLPKMKTHKKTGVTCCLKNLVGINGDKNWLPHHTEGTPETHGDEFPQITLGSWLEQKIKRLGLKLVLRIPVLGSWAYRKMRNTGKRVLGDSQEVIRNGNWDGNNTCWRMALDLNRCLLFGNPDGTWRSYTAPKHYLAIVDGIVGGEGNGPLCPDAVQSKVLVSGVNPAEVDAVVATLMGFDPKQLPIVRHAFGSHRWPITTAKFDELEVFDKRVGGTVELCRLGLAVEGGFAPHFGWAGLKNRGQG